MGDTRPLLDPSQYTLIPRVAVLDETTLPVPKRGGEEGEYEFFQVDGPFLEKVAFNGNRRESDTGDMTPIVIGRHTKKGAAETSQPEIVGWARNWSTGKLGNTTRTAAFADFWIKNEDVERVRKYPRRSAEIWRGRAEIDPIALLGATTPERDLGLLPIALHRHPDQEISATFYCDRGFDMPTEMKPGQDVKDEGSKQSATPSLSDLTQSLNKLAAMLGDMNAKLDKLTSGGVGGDGQDQPGAGADAGAAAGGAAGEPGSEMSDEEIEQLIQELEGGQGAGAAAGAPPGAAGAAQPPRKDEAPVQTMGYPGGQNTVGMPKEEPMKQNREENAEVAQLRLQVEALQLERSRDDVTAKLKDLRSRGVHIEDLDAEVRDILALPSDMRPAQLSRIEKNYRRVSGRPLGAVLDAAGNSGVVGEISEAQRDEVVRLARDDGLSYEAAFKKKFGRFPWEPSKAV